MTGKPARPEDPEKIMERLDALLAATQDLERLRMGMGIRLALGMAQELRLGAPLGSRTADMVAAWTEEHGQDSVDMAVRIAREFLTKPDELRKALGKRLESGSESGTAPGEGTETKTGAEAGFDSGDDTGSGPGLERREA